jgi:hypothetical protein
MACCSLSLLRHVFHAAKDSCRIFMRLAEGDDSSEMHRNTSRVAYMTISQHCVSPTGVCFDCSLVYISRIQEHLRLSRDLRPCRLMTQHQSPPSIVSNAPLDVVRRRARIGASRIRALLAPILASRRMTSSGGSRRNRPVTNSTGCRLDCSRSA